MVVLSVVRPVVVLPVVVLPGVLVSHAPMIARATAWIKASAAPADQRKASYRISTRSCVGSRLWGCLALVSTNPSRS